MPIYEGELARVVADLQSLVGARLTDAWQPARDRVVLELGGRLLLLVPRGPWARLHTVASRPANPRHPFSFQGALRSRLGARLVALTAPPGERVVELRFDTFALHLRMTGGRGGLWLLEGDAVVTAFDGPAPAALPELPPPPPAAAPRPPRFTPAPGEGWDLAARHWFGAIEAQERQDAARRSVITGLQRELDRARRLEDNLTSDLGQGSRAAVIRRQADALAVVVHTLKRGTAAVALQDPLDPERTWNLALDPARPPAEALNRLYHTARRLERAADQVLERLERTEERIRQLGAALDEAATCPPERLAELQRLLPAGAEREGDAARQPWFTWRGPHGETVLVGRDARGNRMLTFQRARGTDWWMHLRGAPGAHLVLRLDASRSPSLELLLAAAQIALAHAQVAEGTAAEVQYTRVRDVRSVPGAADGLVRVSNEKVLRVVRERALLERWTRDG